MANPCTAGCCLFMSELNESSTREIKIQIKSNQINLFCDQKKNINTFDKDIIEILKYIN